MTLASAFNDITVAKGGTPNKSGTIAGAIDALNDTLAGSDQPASVTIEGAIKRLGENIGGGGGSFGTLQFVCIEYDQPVVGYEVAGGPHILEISTGGRVITGGNLNFPITAPVAAGLMAVSYNQAQYTECDAFVCCVDENYEYTSVTPWDGDVTIGSIESQGETYSTFTLTVPELDFDPDTYTGQYLVLYTHASA